ncbi:DUF4352 domain-containing protein [Rhodococcus rhodochrous]|uniref:DUF4352 domain-containing protein n=1 Tax=Rhodococcus rhodochrous TaxID=1829 RepID=UPI0011C356DC
MGRLTAALLATAVGLVTITGCGSDDEADTAAESSTTTSRAAAAYSTASPPAASATTQPRSRGNIVQVGQLAVNGGVHITVHSIRQPETISVRAHPNFPSQGFKPISPRPGGKFIMVDATVVNETQRSIDLTCGWPIANKMQDARDRMYDAYDDLHYIEGNPGCNDGLQPGFDSRMIWVYEMPVDARPVAFVFYDTSELGDRTNPAGVLVPTGISR